GEEAFAKPDGRVLVGAVEAGVPPRCLGRLDDEGRVAIVEAVGVNAPQPVLGFLEQKGEGIEMTGGAEPDELVRSPIEPRAELRGVELADSAVDTVGTENEIGAREGGEIDDLAAEQDLDAERLGATLQDVRRTWRDRPEKP